MVTPQTTIEATGTATERDTVRRRGLVAGAAALVAGLMARGIADAPAVAAANGGDIIIGANNNATRTTTLSANPGFDTGGASSMINADGSTGDLNAPIHGISASGSGNRSGVVGQGGSNGGTGLEGYGGGSGSGVHGIGNSGIGVFGESTSGPGVRGTSGATGGEDGVRGLAYGTGRGVSGFGAIGVQGNSTNGKGMEGIDLGGTGTGVNGVAGGNTSSNTTGFPIGVRGAVTDTGFGVRGEAGNGSAIYGVCTGGYGVGGLATGGGYAVVGTSAQGVGVYGSNTGGGASPFGVVGSAQSAPGFALYGIASVAGTVGFAAGTTAVGGIAGQFSGPVNIYNTSPDITGDLYVQGNQTVSGTKSAAVPHPDGSHRLLYCVESPEAWFEDFGEGTITAGKATVTLDPDFAAVVDTSKLHVFFTPHDEHHTLHLTARSGGGFSVAAVPSTLGAAAGTRASDVSGGFTYRVVAKRKDVKADRLAKFAVPKEIKLAPPPVPSLPTPPPKKG